MIKKVTTGEGESRESKIISTQDVVLGTGISLDECLSKQSKDIQDLKKWTKWTIKYGGMGTGSGGSGGSSSVPFRYSLTLKNSDKSVSYDLEKGKSTKLDGPGVYYLNVELSKTQGHAFRITYQVGAEGIKQTTTVAEGETSKEIK